MLCMYFMAPKQFVRLTSAICIYRRDMRSSHEHENTYKGLFLNIIQYQESINNSIRLLPKLNPHSPHILCASKFRIPFRFLFCVSTKNNSYIVGKQLRGACYLGHPEMYRRLRLCLYAYELFERRCKEAHSPRSPRSFKRCKKCRISSRF